MILLLLIAAFSTETRNAPANRAFPIQPLSACALVTRADVEDALGRQVGAGSEETEGHAAAGGLGDAFYFDLPGAGTQLHILDGSSAHLMTSILGFGEAPQVSGAAARIAGRALRRL